MSWRASAWAKEQRLGSPAAKSILLCLADYADPDKAQCWPSQTQLAADAEVSERTAREWLQRLEEWGLIDRQRRTRDNGARATDMIVLNLAAKVLDGAEKCRNLKACETEDDADLPAEIAGRPLPAADAEPTGNECTPTGNGCRAYKEEPSNRTSQRTSQPGAQARERGDLEDRRKAEAAYWRIIRIWPRLNGMPKDTGLRAFMDLDPADRVEAERKFPAWLDLLKAQGKDHVHAPSTYFGKRLWQDVPDPAAAPEPTVIDAPAFGPHWSAVRMRALLAEPPQPGPKPSAFMAQLMAQDDAAGRAARLERQASHGWPVVNRMHDGADNRRGVCVAVGSAAAVLAEAMEPVPVGSPMFEAWREEHRRRGWPWLPDTGAMRVVYFPTGGPAGLGAFEAKITDLASRAEGAPAGRPSDDGQSALRALPDTTDDRRQTTDSHPGDRDADGTELAAQ